MDFKFKKGSQVHIKFTEMFSSYFGGVSGIAKHDGLGGVVTDCRVHSDGKNQYKIKGFTGWWDEVTLQEVKE